MLEVGGTKIERTWARYIFLPSGHINSRKVIFWVKRSVPENFQRESFSGLLPKESLGTKGSENVVGLGDRASVLIAAQSEVTAKNR